MASIESGMLAAVELLLARVRAFPHCYSVTSLDQPMSASHMVLRKQV